jgi:HK97 family phage major capsid protein
MEDEKVETTEETTAEETETVEEETNTEDEAVKSIVDTLNKKVDEKLAKAVGVLERSFKANSVSNEAQSNTLTIDTAKYDQFKKALKTEGRANVVFEIKDFDFRKKSTVGDMSKDGNIAGEYPQGQLDPMVSRAPQREPYIEQLVAVGTITSDLDTWVETTSETGAPLPVAELATLPQKDYYFRKFSAEVKKVGVYSKYSREMAEDLPNLISEINNFLIADLRRAVDTQLLSGDGDDEELIGLLEHATAYSAGDFAGTIDEANHFDVIETAVAQVLTALHTPDYIVIHPTDRAKLRLAKGTDGHYVLPPFIMSDGSVISGVRVIVNTGMTAGKFLVGDFRKASLKYKRGLVVEMSNSNEDDFINDLFTVKATVRLVQRVRANDYEAFVYGDFATAISALETTS